MVTWRENKSATGKGASMPDGLILLKAVRKIQTAYRAKKARRLLNDQRKLLDLTTRLEIYSERCDLWFEQGELYYYRRIMKTPSYLYRRLFQI